MASSSPSPQKFITEVTLDGVLPDAIVDLHSFLVSVYNEIMK